MQLKVLKGTASYSVARKKNSCILHLKNPKSLGLPLPLNLNERVLLEKYKLHQT